MLHVFQEETYVGFGDLLNMISYENRYFSNTDITYHYDEDKTKILKFILDCVLEPNKNINRFFSSYVKNINNHTKHFLKNHLYWPTRIKHNPDKIFSISLSLYRHNDVSLEKRKRKAFSDNEYFSILRMLKKFKIYNLVHDHNEESTIQNMNYMSKSHIFIGSEGGMSHIARAMGVPSILYFNNDANEYNIVEIVQQLMDKKIQTLCTDKDLFYNTICDRLDL